MDDDPGSAAPAVLTLDGDLTAERFGAVSEQIEHARRSNVPLIVDLSAVNSIDGMIAMDLVLFLRRRMRHGTPFVVVVPQVNPGWITGAGSLSGALFCTDRAEAIRLLQDA
ncbi:MAG: STAS domain-containing protein [Candidatus Eremiobacteraeota bacterium]|nr:STAS domain-containing protein [Candidatus Eremiobacteraeota bacterium]